MFNYYESLSNDDKREDDKDNDLIEIPKEINITEGLDMVVKDKRKKRWRYEKEKRELIKKIFISIY